MVGFKIGTNEITSKPHGIRTKKNVHFRALPCPKVEQRRRR